MTRQLVVAGPSRTVVALGVAGAGLGTAVSWLDLYLLSSARDLCVVGMSAFENSGLLVFSVQPVLWAVNILAFTLLYAGLFPLFLNGDTAAARFAGVLACLLLTAVLVAASVWISMAVWSPEQVAPGCAGGHPPWWPSWAVL